MPKFLTGPNVTVTSERPMIPVESSGHHTPDQTWMFTDDHGHVHRFDASSGLPTLRWVITATYWCADCSDEHEEGEWRCIECDSVVEPRYLWSGPESLHIPGLMTRTLTVDGVTEIISESEYRAITEGAMDEMQARALAVMARKVAAAREP